jgi:hypothetical protein
VARKEEEEVAAAGGEEARRAAEEPSGCRTRIRYELSLKGALGTVIGILLLLFFSRKYLLVFNRFWHCNSPSLGGSYS